VTSATLMVGLPAAESAAIAWASHPDLGVGLHVTLTGGDPVLPPARVPSLVDGNGRLPTAPEGLVKPVPEQVQAEVEAQLDRFRELTGRLPTHLDSHHHAHRLPVVCDALMTVARRWRLPVRRASPAIAARLRQAGVPTTDFFVERFFGADARREVLLDILSSLAPGLTEIMCHPARVDDQLRHESSYVDERELELEILTDPAIRRAVQTSGAFLTHFGRL
jgi:predicted glycoside hydrolase/deacetylase ChbG (UPF0249 family)